METAEIKLTLHTAEQRAAWFTGLYEASFPKVARFVANRGGTFEDAKDIFHDALVILYEKAVASEQAVALSEEHYVVGIAKHLWIRKFNEDARKVGIEGIEKMITIPEDYYDTSSNRLVSLLELTGRKCMQLLRAFYYENLSLFQIKTEFGFSSAHSASAQKFKCIEKVRNIIREKSLGHEDFK
jgi:DNA-directed RNA polymerase specialized sigma24 family protein